MCMVPQFVAGRHTLVIYVERILDQSTDSFSAVGTFKYCGDHVGFLSDKVINVADPDLLVELVGHVTGRLHFLHFSAIRILNCRRLH